MATARMTTLASTSMSRLVNPGIAQLFTVSAADWSAMNDQAAAVVSLQGHVNITYPVDGGGSFTIVYDLANLTKTVPPFAALRDRSIQWQSSTFGEIVNHAEMLSEYAESAIAAFSQLQNEISNVPPGHPVLAQLWVDMARVELQQLDSVTSRLATEFSTIAGAIDDFRIANVAVEEYFTHNPNLVPAWRALAPKVDVSASFAGVVGHLKGIWLAMQNDVAAAAADGVDVTMPFLAGLDLASAIADWQTIRAEASAFGRAYAGMPPQGSG